MAQKKWEDLILKEKIAGIIGLAIIVLLVVSGISALARNSKPSLGAASTPGSGPSQQAVNNVQDTLTNPAAVVQPKVYTGTGDDVIDIQKPTDGAAIVTFDCQDCTDNTIVKSNGFESLLVNTIGTYNGSHIIDIHEGSNTTQVTISATGDWTLTISGLDKATLIAEKPITGHGDSVLYLAGNTSKATITNTGDDNFVVNAYPTDGGYADLAVNTIGGYKGTVPLNAPAYVQIESNGDWSLTPN